MNVLVIPLTFVVMASFGVMDSALADRCQSSSFTFRFQGETVNASIDSGKSGCFVNYHAFGRSIFTESKVANGPKHGSLSKSGGFTFTYLPKGGYVGADVFAIKICGHGTTKVVGCSTIRYTVDVR